MSNIRNFYAYDVIHSLATKKNPLHMTPLDCDILTLKAGRGSVCLIKRAISRWSQKQNLIIIISLRVTTPERGTTVVSSMI